MKYVKDYTTQVHNILKQHSNPIYRATPKFIVKVILTYFTSNISLSMLENRNVHITGYFRLNSYNRSNHDY